MAKIVNTGAPPTVDAVPVTNHPTTINSTATGTSEHVLPTIGGGGTK